MDWKECWKKRIVKEINSDENLIKSLIGKSEKRKKSS